MASEVELVVKIANTGASQAIRDVAKLQDSLKQISKDAKDTNAAASALGKAFNLPSDQVDDLAEALRQAKGDAEKLASSVKSTGENTAAASAKATAAAARIGQQYKLTEGQVAALARRLDSIDFQIDKNGKLRETSGRFIKIKDEVEKVGGATERLNQQVDGTANSARGLDSVISGLAAGAAFAALNALTGALQAAGQAVLGFIANTLEVGGAAQQADVAFTTILGSAEKAQALLGELSDFAATTPFDLPGVRAAGQQLLAFGFVPETITENLTRLGDVAAGVNTDFGELATIYGKARVQGRLFAEDVNQLTERGIPIIQEFAKQFGVTESEVKKLVESGEIGFPQLEQAFISMTGAGGQFSGLMAAQAKTIPGQVSNISDGFIRLQEALFKAFEPALAGGLGAFSGILAEVGKQSEGFGALAAASERLGLALANNPEIVESLGAAFAGLADTAIDQLSQILDALTAFLSTEGNVAQMADQISALSEAITAIGQSVRFLIALADGTGQLVSAAESLPVVGDNFDRFLKFPTPFTALAEALRLVGEVILIVKDAVIDAVDATLDRTGKILPVLNPIINQIKSVLGLLRTDPAGATTALDGIPGALTEATAALGTAGDAVDELAGKEAAPVIDPKPAEDGLKRITDANKAALDDLSTDATNARAAILEAGGDPAKLAALEAQTLRDRIQNNRDFLAELQALQANGGLSVEDAAAVADQIRTVDGQLASDRVSLAQNILSEKQRTEKAAADAAKAAAEEATKAAEQAEKDRVQAINDGAALQIASLRILAEQRAALLDQETQAARDQLALLTEDQAIVAASLTLEQERLETALAQAEATGNTAEAERLRAEIIAANGAALAQEFEFKRQQLEIESAIAATEAQRAVVLADIAVREAEINLTKAQGLGASEAEISNLRAIVDLRKQDAAAAQTAVGVTEEIQGLKGERLDLEEGIAEENLKQADAQDDAKKSQKDLTAGAEGENKAKQKTADLAKQIAEAEERRAAALVGALKTQQQETAESLKQLEAIRERFKEAQQAGLFQEQGAEFNAAAQQLERILGSGGSLKDLIQFAQNTESDIAKQLLEGIGRGDVLQLIDADKQLKLPLEDGAVAAGQTLEEALVRGAERGAVLMSGAVGVPIIGARRDGGPVRGGSSYLVGEEGPELVRFGRSGYVMTAQQTAALLSGVPVGRRGLSVPSVGGTGEVVRKLDELIKTVQKRPPVRPQATYNLSTPQPTVDAVAMQLEEIRGLVRMGRL